MIKTEIFIEGNRGRTTKEQINYFLKENNVTVVNIRVVEDGQQTFIYYKE